MKIYIYLFLLQATDKPKYFEELHILHQQRRTSLKLVNLHRMQLFIRRIWNYRPLNSWLHTFFKQNSYETTNKVSGYGDVKLNKYAILDKAFPLSISIAPEFQPEPKIILRSTRIIR
jgi:hypothetical protein